MSPAVPAFFLGLLTVVATHAETIWQLDNLDTIGGHAVTVEGNPRVIATPGGRAIEFDGIDDVLFLDTHPLAGLAAFTVEVVFNPYSGGPAEQRFFHMQENASVSRLLFETRLPENNRWSLDTFICSGTQKIVNHIPSALHPTDTWHHAAVVIEGTAFRHFVNGKLETEKTLAYAAQTPGRTSLGARLNRVGWFKGAIRTIRFTPRPLGPADFLVTLPAATPVPLSPAP
jgi:hypothetical protein